MVQWEMADKGACLKYIKIFDTTITCASMTPDGKTIVVGGQCGTVKYVLPALLAGLITTIWRSCARLGCHSVLSRKARARARTHTHAHTHTRRATVGRFKVL